MIRKQCEHCKKEFYAEDRRTRFCSPAHRDAAYRVRKGLQNPPHKCALARCDTVFQPRTKNNIYCCHAHQLEANGKTDDVRLKRALTLPQNKTETNHQKFVRLQKEARDKGMSYGQYMGWRYINGK